MIDDPVHARGENFLHAVADSGTWEASLTAAIGKISQQAQRVKGKWQGKGGRQREEIQLTTDDHVSPRILLSIAALIRLDVRL